VKTPTSWLSRLCASSMIRSRRRGSCSACQWRSVAKYAVFVQKMGALSAFCLARTYGQPQTGPRSRRHMPRDVGIQAAKQGPWDPTTHPVLAWSWRPRQFPDGADERTDKNDSVLAVYAVFPSSKVTVKAMKYIWSEKVPTGSALSSNSGLTQVRVVQTGRIQESDAEDAGSTSRPHPLGAEHDGRVEDHGEELRIIRPIEQVAEPTCRGRPSERNAIG